MSPSRSKSKDKRAGGKEPPKSSTKHITTANSGGSGGVTASGYNPVLGTFHTLEAAPVSSVPPVHVNGRFRDIDDTDDPSGNTIGTTVEYDCVSNNGSWSGESEDPKDKPSQLPLRHEINPGVDNDKREKIRQKNEKKHQRQKERRAQELHERCCGYLMSRKLEALAQQLVAMGFPSERATMALIMNEGKLEESVAWLFEGGEDSDNPPRGEHNNLDSGGGNLKVDISQELAQIADMEVKFKCSKQEVERAVVTCEGNLEQAAENLIKVQKQESNAALSKTEESNGKPSESVSSSSNVQPKRILSSGAVPQVQPKPEDLTAVPGGRNIQLLKKVHPNSAATSSVDKRWMVGGLTPSVSYSLASPLQTALAPPPTPLSKTEKQYATIGNEFKNLQLREPVVMMQRPQSKHILTNTTSSSASHVTDWNYTGVGVVEPVMGMNPNGFSHMPTIVTTRSFNTPSFVNGISNQVYDPFHYQQNQEAPLLQQRYGSRPVPTNHLNNNTNGMWNRMMGGGGGTATPLAAASSLGLFSGLGSSGVSGQNHVDWNGGERSSQFDYTNIDWSLNRLPSPAGGTLRSNGMWAGVGSSPGKSVVRPTSGNTANGNSGISIGRVGVAVGGGGGGEASGGGSREWASPFEEKDLFSLPRQFVSSPSL